MARCHHVADTVTLPNHRIRDPSITGTTLERFRTGSHGPGTADTPLTQPRGGTRSPRTAQHRAPPRREQLHGRVTRLGPNHRPKPGTNTNREAALDPRSQQVAARRLAHRPHTDSSIPRFPDPRIGRAAVGPQRATRSPACPKLRRPREATRRHRRRPSISAQSTESGPSACPGSLFPGDGCLPRQGRFVSALVTLRSPGGGGTQLRNQMLRLWRTPRSLGTGGTETGCNNNDEVTANNHNVSRCKYKFNCLD